MSEKNTATKKRISFDWLMKGVLTKFGDVFDSLTGRRWKPSSSLATSELTERLKKLLDLEVKDLGEKGKFVPHNLKLKMQWDKFSTDSEKALKILHNELMIAAIDHINDNRYQTFEPLNLEVKPDYFTEGVKLLASFDKIGKEEREVVVNVTVPDIKVGDYAPETQVAEIKPEKAAFVAEFNENGKPRVVELEFSPGTRRSVGRNKQNDLTIDDNSVSKIHAALVLNRENQFQIADTGSTNGTFINDRRISYGRAMTISETDKIKFGTVEVKFKRKINAEIQPSDDGLNTNAKTEILLNTEETDFRSHDPTADDKLKKADKAEITGHGFDKKHSDNANAAEADEKELTQQGIIFEFENQPGAQKK